MKVQLFISKDYEDSHAEIYTDKLNDNIEKAIHLLENEDGSEDVFDNDILAVKKDKDIIPIAFDDIYMIRVENKEVKVYSEKEEYVVKKPLYKIESNLTSDFVRISKSSIINIKKIERVAPSFKGMMFVSLKNDLRDNISRKYLTDFKKTLDL